MPDFAISIELGTHYPSPDHQPHHYHSGKTCYSWWLDNLKSYRVNHCQKYILNQNYNSHKIVTKIRNYLMGIQSFDFKMLSSQQRLTL